LDGPIGPWHLVTLFNWEDSAQDIVIRMCDLYLEGGEEMVASEFWTGRVYRLPHTKAEEQKLVFKQVPAHGAVVLAIRKHYATRPQYLGGNLHISQGSEVSRWQPGEKTVKVELQRPGPSQGNIILSVPGQIVSASLNQARLSWQPMENSIYSFHLDFNHRANIEITYS
jgi:hypothetical protein